MKKILSVLLPVLLILSCLIVSVPAAEYKLGDVDLDGQVLAKDARSILRYSAKLETDYNDLQVKLADVDGLNGVNAADARLALRTSAKLVEEVTIEIPDEDPTQPEPTTDDGLDDVDIPRDIDAFLNGNFSFSGTIKSGSEQSGLEWSKNAKNSKFTAVQTFKGDDGADREVSITIHIKYKTRTSNYYYLLNNTDKTCCDFTDVLKLDDTGEMQAALDAMNSLSFGDTGGARLAAYGSETIDDVEYESYTFDLPSADGQLRFLTLDGGLKMVYVLDADGVTDSSITMTEFSAKPGDELFVFPPRGYKEVSVITFASGMGLTA